MTQYSNVRARWWSRPNETLAQRLFRKRRLHQRRLYRAAVFGLAGGHSDPAMQLWSKTGRSMEYAAQLLADTRKRFPLLCRAWFAHARTQ